MRQFLRHGEHRCARARWKDGDRGCLRGGHWGTAIPGAAAASAAEAAIAVAAGAAAIAPRAALAVGVVGLGIGSSGIDDHTAVTAFPLALAAHTLHLADGRVDDAALVGIHGLHGKAAAGAAHLGTDAL